VGGKVAGPLLQQPYRQLLLATQLFHPIAAPFAGPGSDAAGVLSPLLYILFGAVLALGA